ncbi:MAG TPA: CBS domain-containing protein [Streptomyces sp.]|nr:CBS domain-containing protein [Streptomyces sp.]
MAQQVREIMTGSPVTVGVHTAVTEVASLMREKDIGAVLVLEGEQLRGLVTDRDLVIRVIADGKDPNETTAQAACSETLTTVAPEDPIDRAVALMREGAVRRLPVVDNGHPVGIIALGDISAASPNQ